MVKIVGLSGSPSASSRTRKIVDDVLARVASETHAQSQGIDLSELTHHLGIASRDRAHPSVEEALKSIEGADLLIWEPPFTKARTTGMLKHLIDLVDYRALAGIPVGLIATGGSDRHALVIEHELRPLFGFFSAQTLATGVFILDKTIVEGKVEDETTKTRLDQLVSEAAQALRPKL